MLVQKSFRPIILQGGLAKKTFVFIEEPASFSAPTGGSAGQQMGVFVPALAPPSPNYLSKGQLISNYILFGVNSSKMFGRIIKDIF